MRRTRSNAVASALVVVLVPLSAALAVAQAPAQKSVVRPTRVAEPPRIDGRLDEPLWATIEPITDFRQWEPDNGAPASERTEVRIGYDDEFLYVGVRAFDGEPSRIVARQFERDACIDNDDAFTIELDSLSDNRTTFFFESNVLAAQSDGQIFFSRRIGIRCNREVPIIGGTRAYGLVGSTNVGLTSMQTSGAEDFRSESFTVARVKHNLFGRSYVGGIVTSRRGDTGVEDTTAGGDLRLIFGVNTRVAASLARSERPRVDSGNWFANASASQGLDRYEWSVQYTDIGEAFEPGVGFVRRQDLRRWRAEGRFKPRPGWRGVRQLNIGGQYERIENHGGGLETQRFEPSLALTLQSEDVLSASYSDERERVTSPFPIGSGLVVPAGDYRNRRSSARLCTNAGRWWAVVATHSQGGYYGGDLRSSGLTLTLKRVPSIELRSQNQLDAVDVPGGHFDSLISRLFASYYFSPRLTTRLGVQYSSLFDDLVVNFRIRWIYTPGSEAWIVYDESRDLGLPGESLRDRALIVKVAHNFHF